MSKLRILQIHSSGRKNGSFTRRLSEQFVDKFRETGAQIVIRDLADGMPFVDESWIGANFTPAGNRTADQSATLSLSDSLVRELEQADIIVIGAPVYNFSIPTALKAWIDQVMRARVTFQYTANGPVGLLKDKRAVIVMASGGVKAGSEYDYATSYLKFALSFMGVKEIALIAADALSIDSAASEAAAQKSLVAALEFVAAPRSQAA